MTKDKPDSLVHHEERAAKMRASAEAEAQRAAQAEEQRKQQQAERDHTTRHELADELEAHAGVMQEVESREQLLERIRQMREDTPVEPTTAGFRSPDQQAAFEAEQKAGREAVAKAEADMARAQEARAKAEEDERFNAATTVSVHHPNPDQDEIFPTVKATLPGSGQTRKK